MRGEREFTIEIGKTLVVCFIWKNKRKIEESKGGHVHSMMATVGELNQIINMSKTFPDFKWLVSTVHRVGTESSRNQMSKKIQSNAIEWWR